MESCRSVLFRICDDGDLLLPPALHTATARPGPPPPSPGPPLSPQHGADLPPPQARHRPQRGVREEVQGPRSGDRQGGL